MKRNKKQMQSMNKLDEEISTNGTQTSKEELTKAESLYDTVEFVCEAMNTLSKKTERTRKIVETALPQLKLLTGESNLAVDELQHTWDRLNEFEQFSLIIARDGILWTQILGGGFDEEALKRFGAMMKEGRFTCNEPIRFVTK